MSAQSLFSSALVLVLALSASPASWAAPEAAAAAARENRFPDTDGDGALSPEEFAAGLPHLRPSAFPAMDADQDGRVSREEWLRVRREHWTPDSEPLRGGGDPASAAPGDGTGRGPDLLLPPDDKTTSR